MTKPKRKKNSVPVFTDAELAKAEDDRLAREARDRAHAWAAMTNFVPYSEVFPDARIKSLSEVRSEVERDFKEVMALRAEAVAQTLSDI